jgi:siroheme synthase (precorrin-2 oxidase/ferrochelatase)
MMHQTHLDESILQRDKAVKHQVDAILKKRDDRLAQTAKIIESTLFPVEDAQKTMMSQIEDLKRAFEQAKAAKEEEVSRLSQQLLDADKFTKMLLANLKDEEQKSHLLQQRLDAASASQVCCSALSVPHS